MMTTASSEMLMATTRMENVEVLPEPTLEFRHGQAVSAPHDGLTLFGPFDTDEPYHPASISYALIGTSTGLDLFLGFGKALIGPIYAPPNLAARLWPMFPGFEAVFHSVWSTTPTRSYAINVDLLEQDSLQSDPKKRAAVIVERYLGEIRRIREADERVDVIVCIVPDFVYERCRPRSYIPTAKALGPKLTRKQRRSREAGQRDLFDQYDPAIYQYSEDFRRQIKARSMEHDIPIQIIIESTLLPDDTPATRRGLTCLSDRAWNLGVALYYKAGGKPWRLNSAREGVCYIGLAYRRSGSESDIRSAACAAQMFLDSGDGIVFMGKYGPWFSPRDANFHLTKEAAKDLLAGTLQTYRDLDGPPLKEIFLHCRSGINEEEFSGFRKACPEDVKLVGVRVRKESRLVRLLREGTRPVLRGTYWVLDERSAFLWATGFKPRLGTYDGWEIPVPLRIDIQHGDAEITQVVQDILGLTKLNYNSCKLAASQPVTIGFSDAVGEILVSNPGSKARSPKFKFYI